MIAIAVSNQWNSATKNRPMKCNNKSPPGALSIPYIVLRSTIRFTCLYRIPSTRIKAKFWLGHCRHVSDQLITQKLVPGRHMAIFARKNATAQGGSRTQHLRIWRSALCPLTYSDGSFFIKTVIRRFSSYIFGVYFTGQIDVAELTHGHRGACLLVLRSDLLYIIYLVYIKSALKSQITAFCMSNTFILQGFPLT